MDNIKLDTKVSEYCEDFVNKYKFSQFIAKSDGTTLETHTKNVIDNTISVLNTKHLFLKKVESKVSIDNLLSLCVLSALYHDWGKSNEKWQKHCENGNLISVGIRHEVVKIFDILKKHIGIIDSKIVSKIDDKLMSIIISVLGHHSNLSLRENKKGKLIKTEKYLRENNNKDISTLDSFIKGEYNGVLSNIGDSSIIKLIQLYSNEIKREDVFDIWYLTSFVRHFLQLSDKRASMIENSLNYPSIGKPPIINEKFKYSLNEGWGLRNLQKMALDNSDDSLLILRAPTGSGKTLASILWSNKQVEMGRCDRMILAMPTQFTTNSLYNDFKNSYGIDNTFKQHSGVKLDMKVNHEFDYMEYSYSNTFERDVTICTIDHILNSLTLNNEDSKSRALNITSSCIIIDECDFYDDFIISNIMKLLYFTKKFDIPVMIMSATLPDSFVGLIETETKYKNLEVKDDISDSKRTRVNIMGILDNIDEKLKYIAQNEERVIVYCNTVDESIEVYKKLKDFIENPDELVLYHSRFKEVDKTQKEEKIINLLGKKAHEEGRAKGIVVMTQIGELSIDISCDYMLSCYAPIDRLIQRFGRGRRFDKEVCRVELYKPYKNGQFYPAPYGEYSLEDKAWIPNEALVKTIDILKKEKYNVSKYIKMVNDVYPNMEINRKSKINSDNLFKTFRNNIFLNSKDLLDEEVNDSNLEWKCRDIDEQMQIYIGDPMDNYNTYSNLEMDRKLNYINLATYLSKTISNVKIDSEISINKSGEKVDLVHISDDYYDKEYGLDLVSIKEHDNIENRML